MKPLVLFSSLAVVCAGGLLALSYQGWRDDPSVVSAMSDGGQTVSIDARKPVSQPPASAGEQAGSDQLAAVQPGTAASGDTAQAPATGVQGEAATPAVDQATNASAIAPTFDIVRIEEDGSTLLAGRAQPGSTVTALLNGETLGQATVDERGEWVILPSSALPPGAHDLTLSQTAPDGALTRSEQSVALTVPDAPGSQPLIVLSENAKPSRVLQKPEDQPAASATAEAERADTTVAAVEPDQGGQTSQPSGTEPQAETAAQPQAVVEPQPTPAPTPVIAGGRNLTVDVVDYDAEGRTTFSGKATPGARVRLYVSERFTGEAEADASGAWNLTASREIAAGTHSLRADQIGNDGKVAARIELPFLRESPERIAGLQAQRADAAVTSPAPQHSAQQDTQPTQAETRQEPATDTVASSGTSQDAASQPAASQPADGQVASAQPAAEPAAVEGNEKGVQGPGRVVIQPGNNLWQISRVIYGKGVQYTVIYEANKDQIRDPDLIYPGQILDTPGSTAPESIDPDCKRPLAECSEQAGKQQPAQ